MILACVEAFSCIKLKIFLFGPFSYISQILANSPTVAFKTFSDLRFSKHPVQRNLVKLSVYKQNIPTSATT